MTRIPRQLVLVSTKLVVLSALATRVTVMSTYTLAQISTSAQVETIIHVHKFAKILMAHTIASVDLVSTQKIWGVRVS